MCAARKKACAWISGRNDWNITPHECTTVRKTTLEAGRRGFDPCKSFNRMGRALICIFAILAGLRGETLAASDAVGGELGDPARIEFDGAATVSPSVLRNDLNQNPDYLLASHPQALLGPYLLTLGQKIQAGYQQCGFPEARVTANLDEGAGQVRVRISEGHRFRCGAVKIIGGTTVLAKAQAMA